MLQYFYSYKDTVYSFICGFIPSSVYIFIHADHWWLPFTIKIISTAILGFVGGITGILAKKFYNWAFSHHKD